MIPWCSGSALDCWPTSRAINPAPGARLITKFIPLAQVVPGPVSPYSAEVWYKQPFISESTGVPLIDMIKSGVD